jgi:tRNA-Thr(GGU) m(6)t(6)A37 methyltransferase TsaA
MNTMTFSPIGQIRTPYKTIDDCPRNLMTDGPPCRIVVDQEYADGLYGLDPGASILVLYWMDMASFKSLRNTSRQSGETKGVFALRTPHRPNPIAAAVVRIDEVNGHELIVRGLDCTDGTPLLDIKPAMSNEVEKRREPKSFRFWRN